jgi:hypothetical protein
LLKSQHAEFNLKGIQLETLGFIGLRFCMFTPEKDFFNSWHAKFETFQKRNAVDLKHLKVKAMLDQNYEKCDEFYKYEKYLYSAYHKELLTYTK